jgi:hypothetical protein
VLKRGGYGRNFEDVYYMILFQHFAEENKAKLKASNKIPQI